MAKRRSRKSIPPELERDIDEYFEATGGALPNRVPARIFKQAYNLAVLGLNDNKIGEALGIKNIRALKHKDAMFREVLEKARTAPGAVAVALYKRAKGFSRKSEKVFADPKSGRVLRVPTVEYYPPDTTAAIQFLKRHAPDIWGDAGRGSATPSAGTGSGSGIHITIDAPTLALCGVPLAPVAVPEAA